MTRGHGCWRGLALRLDDEQGHVHFSAYVYYIRAQVYSLHHIWGCEWRYGEAFARLESCVRTTLEWLIQGTGRAQRFGAVDGLPWVLHGIEDPETRAAAIDQYYRSL